MLINTSEAFSSLSKLFSAKTTFQLLNSKVRQFDDDIRDFIEQHTTTRLESAARATELRRRHGELCEVIQNFDNIFCGQVFIWHTCCVMIACTESAASVQVRRVTVALVGTSSSKIYGV